MQTRIEWARVMKQLWPDCRWLATAVDADAAVDTIRARFGQRSPDNEELVDVLRWMASSPEWKQDKAPSLRQLIMAVFMCRKDRRYQGDAEQAAQSDCRICVSGWMPAEGPDGNPLMMPCLCHAGERVLGTVREYKSCGDGFRRQREAAHAVLVERRRKLVSKRSRVDPTQPERPAHCQECGVVLPAICWLYGKPITGGVCYRCEDDYDQRKERERMVG